jgi:hypothetical protein
MTLDDQLAGLSTLQEEAAATVWQYETTTKVAADSATRERKVVTWVEDRRASGKHVTRAEADEVLRELTEADTLKRRAAAAVLREHRAKFTAAIDAAARASEDLVPLYRTLSPAAGDYTLAMLRMGDETFLSRMEQRLSTMSPTETAAAYAQALATKDDVAIRAIETHRTNLSTARHERPSLADINAIFELNRTIRTAREARHPEAVTQARAFLAGMPGSKAVEAEGLRLVAKAA